MLNLQTEKQPCTVYSYPELKLIAEYDSESACARALNVSPRNLLNTIKRKSIHRHKILNIKCIIKKSKIK